MVTWTSSDYIYSVGKHIQDVTLDEMVKYDKDIRRFMAQYSAALITVTSSTRPSQSVHMELERHP